MTRDEIVETIKQQSTELLAVLDGIPAEALTKRPLVDWWTGKDLLGHIAMWELVALKFIADYKHDGLPKMLGINGDDELDAHNKRGVVMRRDLPLKTVRAELDATSRDLIAAVESLSDADLTKPLPAPWGEGATLERLIAVNSYQHTPEHIEQITWLKTRVSDPLVK